MPARERGHEHQLDRAILSEDDLRDLSLRPLAQVEETLVRRLPHQCHDFVPPPIVLSSLRATQLSHRHGGVHCVVQPFRTIDRRRRLVNTAGAKRRGRALLGESNGGGP